MSICKMLLKNTPDLGRLPSFVAELTVLTLGCDTGIERYTLTATPDHTSQDIVSKICYKRKFTIPSLLITKRHKHKWEGSSRERWQRSDVGKSDV